MFTIEDIKAYRCPRWEDFPSIDLYIDQLMGVLEKYLYIFYEEDKAGEDKNSKIITRSMVNNYVKHQILNAPENKKYNKHQLSFLYVICIFKKLIGLNEIYTIKHKLLETYTADKAYNIFCDIFERCLKSTFGVTEYSGIPEETPESETHALTITVIESMSLSFANIMYARYLISEAGGAERSDAKTKKKGTGVTRTRGT